MPIRLRLAVLFALGTAVVVGGAGFVFVDQLRAGLLSSLDNNLRPRTESLARTVAAGVALSADGVAAPLGGTLVQVVDPVGTVMAASVDAGSTAFLTTMQLRRAQSGVFVATLTLSPAGASALAGERVRIRAVGVSRPDGTWVAIAADSLETVDNATSRVRQALLFGGPPIVALAGLAAWLIAGGALQPVERMRREVADISEHGADASIDVPRTHDEIAALAATMNDVLGRLKSALDRERRFVADAGHELRTPLAILQVEMELAARPGRSAADLRAAVDSATVEVRRLAALAEDLLSLGHHRSASARRELVTLGPVVRAAANGFSSRAAAGNVKFRFDIDEIVTVDADPGQLRRVVDNLVDNALRYAPPGTDVDVIVRRDAEGLAVVEVRDEGPGFPDAFLPRAFEPFRRADDARSRLDGGTGLGLAIVEEIVTAHRGHAVASNRPDGGAAVRIELPCLPTSR